MPIPDDPRHVRPPSAKALEQAYLQLAPLVRQTPVMTSEVLNEKSGAQLFFKCECLQLTGSFKVRGALNAVLSLNDAVRSCGVATHSSGNHGAALAYAAQREELNCDVIVPKGASHAKIALIESYGANLIYCEATQTGRERALAENIASSGATFIHPYNDPRVIAGQASCALSFLKQVPDLDALLMPIGGGGLIAGSCLAVEQLGKSIKVFGAEPQGADDTFQSMQHGKPIRLASVQTIADGLRSTVGELPWKVIARDVSEVLCVSDQDTLRAMRLGWEQLKVIIEPSSSVALAAALVHAKVFSGMRVGIILTGGNVDLASLPWTAS